MSELNFTLGVVHNTHEHNTKFVNRFNTIEIKNPTLPIPEKKDYLYHSNYSVSLDDIPKALESDMQLLQNKKIRRFSFDAGPCYRKVIEKDYKYYPGETFISSADLIDMTGETIHKIKKIFGNQNTNLAVENLNYYATGAYEDGVCLPEFYNDLSEKYKIEQVLDLAHLKVTAINMKIPFLELLDRVNHDYVREIHLTRIDFLDDNSAIDAHFEPMEDDFNNLLIAINKNTNPNLDIVIEAWRDIQKLQSSFENLNQFIKENSDHKIIFN